jgi:cell wall-associated NlpC family hydrolase
MAMRGGVSGPAVGLATAGGLLIYAAITDKNPIAVLRELATGKTSKPAPFVKPTIDAAGVGVGAAALGAGLSVASGSLLGAAERYLGRPYQWGGTFANGKGGDCSGLIYRAGLDIGLGWPRFTTSTIMFSPYVQRVPVPSVGDIVVWPGMHAGIVSGPRQMLAAPFTGSVVKYQSWKPIRANRAAIYLRVKMPAQTQGFMQKRGIS